MTIELHNFASILPDNEQQYLVMLEAVISSVDNGASLLINKGTREIYFRISPSHPKYSQPLLKDLMKWHNLMSIHLLLSKSIRLTSTISFSISINNKPNGK